MSVSRQNIIGLGVVAILVLASILAPGALAKGKKGGEQGNSNFVWLDGQAVGDLMTPGAFWCMEPVGDTCSFDTLMMEANGSDYTYLVTSFWEENVIIHETLNAHVSADGVLCEPNTLIPKNIKVTDPAGQPVDQEYLNTVLAELEQIYGEDNYPDICFVYTIENESAPHLITQYHIDEAGQPVQPIIFSVDYAANAQEAYSLRW